MHQLDGVALLHDDDIEQAVQLFEVARVASEQWELSGDGGGGDEQVDGSGAPCLAAGGGNRRIHPAVRPGP